MPASGDSLKGGLFISRTAGGGAITVLGAILIIEYVLGRRMHLHCHNM